MKKIIFLLSVIFVMSSCGCCKKSNCPHKSKAESVKSMESVQCVGKVLSIEGADIGKGGAAGKVPVMVVKFDVSSSTISGVKAGDVIHAELVAKPKVMPVVGREYVFKAKNLHPAHAKGVYMLETDVLDLTK